MSDVFAKYAELRRLFPDDAEQITKEEQAVQQLLELKDLSEHPGIKALLQACRETVLSARMQLATDRTLIDTPQKQRELWQLIEARLWFIRVLSRNFEAEIKSIDQQLAQDLTQA